MTREGPDVATVQGGCVSMTVLTVKGRGVALVKSSALKKPCCLHSVTVVLGGGGGGVGRLVPEYWSPL